MGATKQVNLYPPNLTPRTRVQNNRDALSEIIATLAGNAATMRGAIVGGETLDSDTVNPAPLNPGSSLRGHDHSGGIHGAPLFRTVASWNFDRGESLSSNITLNQSPSSTALAAIASGTHEVPLPFSPLRLWVPGCDPGARGAYQMLGLRTVWYIVSTSGGSSGDRLKLRVQNMTTGGVALLETDGTTSTGTKISASASDADRLLIQPGAFNDLSINVLFTASAVAGSRALTVRLLALETGVYATT